MLKTPEFVGFVLLREELLGFVIGCCEQWDNGKHFELKEICVQPESLGLLIGTKLLQRLERTLLEINVSLVYLVKIEGGQMQAILHDK